MGFEKEVWSLQPIGSRRIDMIIVQIAWTTLGEDFSCLRIFAGLKSAKTAVSLMLDRYCFNEICFYDTKDANGEIIRDHLLFAYQPWIDGDVDTTSLRTFIAEHDPNPEDGRMKKKSWSRAARYAGSPKTKKALKRERRRARRRLEVADPTNAGGFEKTSGDYDLA